MFILNQLRFFFRNGQNNVIKVISLGVGLSMGLVLVAKLYFEQSFDSFFPNSERIYRIETNFSMNGKPPEEFSMVSGGVAVGMKTEIPEVELATRYTFFGSGAFYTENRNKYSSKNFVLADSCLFQLFERPILAGNATQALAQPMQALVAASIAEKMGGVDAAMGTIIEIDLYPGRKLTIGGVFADFPENSHLEFDVAVSLPSIAQFTYDGSTGWVGNDRYYGYVKLTAGTRPEALAQVIRQVQDKYLPPELLIKAGVELNYTLLPLGEIRSGTPEAKRMAHLLALLAFAILFTAVMNYVLIAISSIVRRAREMAIHRCYGASPANIRTKMFAETAVHLFLSLALAAILLYAFRATVFDLLGTSLTALLSLRGCLVMAGVCAAVFVFAAWIPGYLFSRIPVTSAFRSYSEHRRKWKLGLLFIQFIAAGFLCMLVVIITRQYNHMINSDTGYSYSNLVYTELYGVSSTVRQTAAGEIGRMPEVAAVSSATSSLLHGESGNMIYLPSDEDRQLFNVADLYSVGDGYFDVMEIEILEGRAFIEGVSQSNEVMVSRSFIDKMKPFADWSDGAVGKQILVSEHSREDMPPFVICGVYADMQLGAIGCSDDRPTVMFYQNTPSMNLLIKFHRQTPEAVKLVTDKLQSLIPDKDIVLYSYATELRSLYTESRRFRDSVLIGSIIALIISLIGLIGYTGDEISRRRKETAIRKVNGATVTGILLLFLRDIAYIALPSLIVAGIVTAFTASRWIEQFNERITLSPILFIVCGAAVFAVIMVVVGINCYRAATANPAKMIKTE